MVLALHFKERSMHVCVAQAPAGRNPILKSVSKQTGLGGAVWADDVHFLGLKAALP